MITQVIEKALWTWLERGGYTCFRNISAGGKFPDIIALKGKTITAFEIKQHTSEITKAVGQCIHYLQKANMVYIVLPAKDIELIPAETKEMLKTYNIGLISGSPTVKIIIRSKKTPKKNLSLIKELNKIEEKKMKSLYNYEEGNIKENIINILKEHPEGLSIIDVSKYMGISRQTVSKYILGLVAERIIKIHKIGPTKLCYLKKQGKNNVG